MRTDFQNRPPARLTTIQGCYRQFHQRVRRPPNFDPGANEEITAPTRIKETDTPDRGQISLGRDGIDH